MATNTLQLTDAAGPPATKAPGAGLPAAMSQDQILKAAQDQVNAEINSQIDPLQNQIGSLRTQQGAAVGQIGTMFDQLQPTVDAGVVAVSDSFKDAENVQAQIFASANNQLNQLKQQRAQDAQRLAQEIGGPVAVGEFTAGYDPAIEALTYLGAGSRLHTLGYAQAGVQEAGAFAGQVFPLLRTEETAQARSYFENEIASVQKQIDSLNASKPTLINSRLAEITQQQLQYRLDVAKTKLEQLNSQRQYNLEKKQARLDQIKANRDWQATLRTLKNDERRLALSERQFSLEEGKTTGTYQGKPTIEARNITAQEKRIMATLDIDRQQLALRKKQLSEAASLARKKLQADQKVTWNEYLDAAVNPQPGKSVSVSHTVEIDATQAYKDPRNSWYVSPDKSSDGKGHYYHTVTTHEVAVTDPITDPDDLYDYLRSHGVPAAFATQAIRNRLGVKSWKPGRSTAQKAVDNIFGRP